ncbi:MAG: adenylate/guanylate cyclase domain-containing protein [Porticoccaceae bacterium]|nr:adenylate/guanylate cyclase domain-containing protein [Porticoccaceae bacterium]MDG1308856.1 adenylate/guanylate cyclase domain-containing protein [Porticoccaceae bacterium]
MVGEEFAYSSPKHQGLYRLIISMCSVAILLGAWADTNHHPALLAGLPTLFVYQFSTYCAVNQSMPWRQRLTLTMAFIDGLITGFLIAFVGYDPFIVIGLGLIFLVTVVGYFKPFSSPNLLAIMAGAALTSWFLPLNFAPSRGTQLFVLAISSGYALLQMSTARRKYFLLAKKHDLVLRQNEWLTLRNFRLSKYLSPALRKAILSGKDVRAQTEEKILTIFFSDIEDFTTLTEELDSEQLANVLNTYLTEMSEIAFRFGGTIDKVIGDSIMVFFGDPQSRGIQADAITCLSMAIAMKRAMIDLQARWRAEGIGSPPILRMGINSGLCKVGNFGTENRLDYTLLGRAVNLASRLETSANSNEILISKDTYELVKDTVHCVSRGKIPIKGFAVAVDIYSAIDLHKHLRSTPQAKHQRHAIA